MKKTKSAAFLFLLLFSFQAFAQDDSTFIKNYKGFRSLVDSYKTFSLYLVLNQSSNKHSISTSLNYFKSAYHFLRGKELVRKNPDFIIAVLVDSLQLEQVSEEVIKKSNIGDYYIGRTRGRRDERGDWTMDVYGKKYQYRFIFNVVVQTRHKGTWLFPLAINEKFVAGESLEMKRGVPIEIFQHLLEQVLEKYRNYYIDRVDW